MNCGRKCPFYWYDGYSCENHCGLSERGGRWLEKFMENDYGCWLPLWLVSIAYFFMNIYDRIDYHTWRSKGTQGRQKMKEQLTQSNVLGMIGYLGSDFNISIPIGSLLSIILDFENKCGFLAGEHSLRDMDIFFEKDPEGYRLDPQQNLHFECSKEYYRQNYFSNITAADAVYLPYLWDIIRSKEIGHEHDGNHIEIRYVQGVEGNSVWLNDMRIGGPKPWGGGKTIESFVVSIDDIKEALKNYL